MRRARSGSSAVKYGGNCMRTPPSLPAARSGSSAARNMSNAASTMSAEGAGTLPRASTSCANSLQLGRERLLQHRVLRHHAERLDVEDEAGRRALRPQRRRARVRDRVERRVGLDRVEALGVVAQTGLGRVDAGRVPHGHHRLVRPAARADAQRSHVADYTRALRLRGGQGDEQLRERHRLEPLRAQPLDDGRERRDGLGVRLVQQDDVARRARWRPRRARSRATCVPGPVSCPWRLHSAITSPRSVIASQSRLGPSGRRAAARRPARGPSAPRARAAQRSISHEVVRQRLALDLLVVPRVVLDLEPGRTAARLARAR